MFSLLEEETLTSHFLFLSVLPVFVPHIAGVVLYQVCSTN